MLFKCLYKLGCTKRSRQSIEERSIYLKTFSVLFLYNKNFLSTIFSTEQYFPLWMTVFAICMWLVRCDGLAAALMCNMTWTVFSTHSHFLFEKEEQNQIFRNLVMLMRIFISMLQFHTIHFLLLPRTDRYDW